jgi:endonuclease/exonuclease/phosphatase family metal-dependent hydrolase
MQYRIILNYTLYSLFILALWHVVSGSGPHANEGHRGNDAMRVVFYNVENLFDPFNDSLKNDEEFTPEGMRAWTYSRFVKKCQDLGRVLVATGGWEAPEIIGLCEVENHFVLRKLLEHSALGRLNYRIVHYESPDNRGIDVAMMYRPEKFAMLHSEPIAVIFPGEGARSTRDILYVKGIALDTDTLHIFVNHWPSRYGGYMATKPLREFTGALLRSRVDSIFLYDQQANILIMGDLNDPPDEYSVQHSLGAKLDSADLGPGELYNLMSKLFGDPARGTQKFRENWSTIDHFIVSQSLLRGERGLKIHPRGASIFDADFLLEDDPIHTGKRLNRTYVGMQYHGGYSDHLPVVTDILRIEN